MDPEYRHPTPGSGGVFGRRAGRRLRKGQSALIETVLPHLTVDLSAPIDRAALFPDCDGLRLEIGFGGGEHLAHEAERHPRTGFIGCEPFRNGVAKGVEAVEARALQNVRIHAGDAVEVIDRTRDGALDGVDLFYPDPWPKRRQRKRRFVSDDTLRRLARVMREGAPFRFATDIDDYAGWTLARVLRTPLFAWTPTGADDWRTAWQGWPSTRYEAKAIREGRPPVYLTFVRTAVAASAASTDGTVAG